MNTAKVLDVFDLSSDRSIIILEFPEKIKPETVRTRLQHNQLQWLVEGYVTHCTPHDAYIKLLERMEQGIYDCHLIPVGHAEKIEKGMLLEIIE